MHSLVIDYTVDKIIKDIITELKNEKEIEVDYDTVKSVIEQQEISTAKGIENGDDIHRKYFGKFILKPRRVNALNNKLIEQGIQPNLEDRGLYTFKIINGTWYITLISNLKYKENGTI